MQRSRSRFRTKLLAVSLFTLGAVRPLHAEPWWCPTSYNFNVIHEYTWTGAIHLNRVYVFQFLFGHGRRDPQVLPGRARYTFGDLYAGIQAVYGNAWMTTDCYRTVMILPPFAEPQPILWVIEQGRGGFFQTLFAEPDEENQCFGEATRVWPGTLSADDETPADARGANGRREPRWPSHRDNNVDRTQVCTPDSNTPVDSTAPPGDGGGGVSRPKWMCLYYDYYDWTGRYLYTVTVTCWDENAT